ncbi:protein of unknown function DUF323 [Crocosphaera watsonii WH 0402]|uniref:Sulfatase-modifying factor enzyme-like domain-containing protein n=1 Tax=Crocosphaera watsonii WH 0402 TaxID=1284629 RepID=T2K0K4_CROWT|nr:SUMF1/EgtB/PvdO family nonheme iron enzyme [Crocosphaera watsonii]CCQ70981.1 protein of unknown function DUF323 [Crocosphaera watsonii WH 0402]
MLTIQRQIWNKSSKFESQQTEHLLLLELSNQDSFNNTYTLEISPFKPQASPERGKISEVIIAYPELRNLETNEQNKVIINNQNIGLKLVLFIKINVVTKHMNDENNGEKEVVSLKVSNQQGNSQLEEVFKINYTGSESVAQTYNSEVEEELKKYQEINLKKQDEPTEETNNNNVEMDALTANQPVNTPTIATQSLGIPIDALTIKLEELIRDQNDWTYEKKPFIDQQTALDLRVLDLSDHSLDNEDLSGLENFANIETLTLAENYITDLEFINHFTKLKYLTITGKTIKNQINWNLLQSLETINFNKNKFESNNNENQLLELKGFSQAQAISFLDNQININLKFDGLENLTHLSLKNNRLNYALSGLGLTKLETLIIESNTINQGLEMNGCDSLTSLRLTSNTIQEVLLLQKFSNLRELNIARNTINQVLNLQGFKDCYITTIEDNKVSNLECHGFDNLESLSIVNNTNLDTLNFEGFSKLKSLNLSRNHLVEVQFLEGITSKQLEKVVLDTNMIENIDSLSKFNTLIDISARNNNIISLSALMELSQLQRLDLSNNRVHQGNQLFQQWQQLTDLNLFNNQIEDLRFFVLLNSLKTLRLDGNPIISVRPLQALASHLETLTIGDITLTGNISEQLTKLPPIQQLETVTVNRKGKEIAKNKFTVFVREIPITKTVKLPVVSIPGGKYFMGEGNSRKQVKVESFWMSQTQITQEQWAAVAQLPKIKTDLNPSPSTVQGNQRPVEQVNWYEAQEFCQRLSKKIGEEIKLPTEEQWEYACRAGTTTPFHFGETLTDKLANYRADNTFAEESTGTYTGQTTDVGSFPPNGFGLYDMHGNVWEWCDSDYDNNNSNKVLRGGSWGNFPSYCRSADRSFYDPGNRTDDIGFRVVVVRRT